MNKSKILITLLVAVLAVCVVVVYKNYSGGHISFRSPIVFEEESGAPPGWFTHSNEKYGIQISYPSSASFETTFKNFYHLGSSWRLGAPENSRGEPLVSIPVFRVDKRGAGGEYVSYPMYFSAEVRVGASRDTQDVAACLRSDAGYENITPATTTIGGVVFYKFPIQNAAMMQYVEGMSYRTVHDGACVAIEQIKTGSSYRDMATSTDDISDAILDSYYTRAGQIVQTFKFLPGRGVRREVPTSSAAVDDAGAAVVGAGEHCGGFIKDAPVCGAGYHCQLNTIADTGGVCVKD